jgi:hypothetical protein
MAREKVPTGRSNDQQKEEQRAYAAHAPIVVGELTASTLVR